MNPFDNAIIHAGGNINAVNEVNFGGKKITVYTLNQKLKVFYVHLHPGLELDTWAWQAYVCEQKNAFPKSIFLWEDVWLAKPALVLSRLNTLLGNFKSYHARLLYVKNMDADSYKKFLNDNHLQGHVAAKYKLGLYTTLNECVAAIGFSAIRNMKYEPAPYYSSELIRYASQTYRVVNGGLSKLIKHFLKMCPQTSLVTYADLDWYVNNSYAKLGFKQVAFTAPQKYWFDTHDNTRVQDHHILAYLAQKQTIFTHARFVPVYNSGSIKFVH